MKNNQNRSSVFLYLLAQKTKEIFNSAGIDIQSIKKKSPADLTGTLDIHPIEATYLAGQRAALVRVSLWRCIHMNYLASPCVENTTSPFILSLLDYREGKNQTYQSSALRRFYQHFQPQSAAEWMGIPGAEAVLMQVQPTLATPFFWLPRYSEDIKKRCDLRIRTILAENIKNFKFSLSHTDGYQLFGPVSQKKGEFEFSRLIESFDNISNKGFLYQKYGNDNINGVWLIRDNEWRVFLGRNGQHRVAAAVAAGLKDIVVHIYPEATGGLIFKSHSHHWPLIRKNELTCKQGESVFDRIFEGRPPASAKKWISDISQHIYDL